MKPQIYRNSTKNQNDTDLKPVFDKEVIRFHTN